MLQEKRAAEIYDEVGQRPSRGSSPDSGTGCKKGRNVATPAHLAALIAAEPCIQVMIQDAVVAGILPKHSLETRLAAVVGTATTTYLQALDDEDRATAKLYNQKKQPKQQTRHGSKQLMHPTVPELENPSSTSQDNDGDDMDISSAPQ